MSRNDLTKSNRRREPSLRVNVCALSPFGVHTEGSSAEPQLQVAWQVELFGCLAELRDAGADDLQGANRPL